MDAAVYSMNIYIYMYDLYLSVEVVFTGDGVGGIRISTADRNEHKTCLLLASRLALEKNDERYGKKGEITHLPPESHISFPPTPRIIIVQDRGQTGQNLNCSGDQKFFWRGPRRQ